jgi:hypothetical protein
VFKFPYLLSAAYFPQSPKPHSFLNTCLSVLLLWLNPPDKLKASRLTGSAYFGIAPKFMPSVGGQGMVDLETLTATWITP